MGIRLPASASGLFPIILLLLLGAGSFWLERATQGDNSRNTGKFRHDPDFVVDNFTVRRFDTSGLLQNTLSARKMTHYPDNDTTDVDAPLMQFNRTTPPARLSSKTGWVSTDGEEVKLRGDVRYLRPGLKGAPDTLITTAEMTLWPDDELARSDVPTTITQGQSVVNGSGLDANNKERLATLRGRVQGIIYSKSQQPSHP